MPNYKAPVSEVLFLLNHVFSFRETSPVPGFSDLPKELTEDILKEAARICEETFFPINQIGDQKGCTYHGQGRVTTPPGFKEAYAAFIQGGWGGIAISEQYGGQGLPHVIANVVNEFAASANAALSIYPGLTKNAIACLLYHGTEAQKELYLPKLTEGVWSGTMNLTEPHCGTDLGLIRTKAVPQAGGTYRVTGQKIFTSSGEHDLTENIIHLVLARIEGAPAGTKGISLFLVPKFLVHPDGSLGERNQLQCGSIEHKMGIHGNATCVMNYDGALGFLVGEPNRGLNAMFVMMNEARLSVGIQGLSISEIAYQNALSYAKERLQMRSLSGPKFPDKYADPIIVHPDVRRMLLTIKSFNEAARALILWTSLQVDIAEHSEEDAAVQAAKDHLGLLTPVIKGVLTDRGFDNAVLAQQIYGGHGYISEWGMEQFVRDARIAMLYEGTNGIQSLDLVVRKLPRDNGRAILAFNKEITLFLREHKADPQLGPYILSMRQALDHLEKANMWLLKHGMINPDNAGAGSYDYMHLLGLVALGYMWLLMMRASIHEPAASSTTQAKLETGRFFMERILPYTSVHLQALTSGAENLMSLPADLF